MPRSTASCLLALTTAAGLACACRAPSTPRRASAAECPASARCVDEACVANAPPVASIALPPAPIATNALLAFDGAASSDPDPGDSVSSYAWAFRAIAAACAPPAVAGTGPSAQVRFACPGTYAADLTVRDGMSAESATASVEFQVLPYDGPALVEAGLDVAVDHACSGTPLTCAPTAEIPLSASAPGADGPASFHWTAIPPDGLALDATRRVTFVPDDSSPGATALIETDATAISGDWVFQVEATDAWGVVGRATTRVSVRNAPPVVTATVPAPDHVFEGTQLSATGEIVLSVSDPDGDPLVDRSVVWHHAGDGDEGLFGGVDLGTKITMAVAVPYAAPSDAAFLIGGEGLERSVELVVRDVNGAETREVWPIVVRNRPPVLLSFQPTVQVDHLYDPADAAYEATAKLSEWVDPDGDPLVQLGSTGDPACATISFSEGYSSVSCTLPFVSVPAVGNFAGPHVVTQHVADPWEETPAAPVTVEILDRPPTFAPIPTLGPLGCATTLATCCLWSTAGGLEFCMQRLKVAAPTTRTASFQFDDPDGDPLEVEVLPAGTVTPVPPICTEHECAVELEIAQTAVCGTATTQVPVVVSDGALSTSSAIGVGWSCL